MSILLCTKSADPRPILARFTEHRCVYLSWGAAGDPQSGATPSTPPDIPPGWEVCDISLAPPAPETLREAGLIVAALPPAAWQEPNGAVTAERLRALAATAALLLLGPSVAYAGNQHTHDGPGLDLIPNTLVLHDLQAVPDLRGLLSDLSVRQTRLLALDGPVCVEYDPITDSVTTSGEGSALLAAFIQDSASDQPTVRVQILPAGASSGWPA